MSDRAPGSRDDLDEAERTLDSLREQFGTSLTRDAVQLGSVLNDVLAGAPRPRAALRAALDAGVLSHLIGQQEIDAQRLAGLAAGVPHPDAAWAVRALARAGGTRVSEAPAGEPAQHSPDRPGSVPTGPPPGWSSPPTQSPGWSSPPTQSPGWSSPPTQSPGWPPQQPSTPPAAGWPPQPSVPPGHRWPTSPVAGPTAPQGSAPIGEGGRWGPPPSGPAGAGGPSGGGRRRRLTLVLVAAGVVLALVAAGLVYVLGAGSRELQRFYTQPLTWRGCAEFATTAEDRTALVTPRLECTTLQVPLSYDDPGGATARIATVRQRATGRPEERIGSLVIESGDNGRPNLNRVAGIGEQLAQQPVGQRFDLVSFDPRGTGASTPGVRCFTPAERDADRLDVDLDTSPAGVARQEAKRRDYAALCEQRSGGRDVLANLGVRDVARDLDILRAALGDPKLTLLSENGGATGVAYVEQFPELVRAVVFDNASDPTADPQDQAVEQWRAFQRSFDRFGAWCTAQPGCPLGNDPNVATTSYRALVSRLVGAPLALPDGRRLSYYDATSGTLNLLYSEADQETLRTALTDLAAGNGQTLMEQADRYHGRQPDGSYDWTDDAFTALSCMNQPVTTGHDAQREFARRIDEAAPWQDAGRGPSPTLAACAFWAAPPTSGPHRPEVSDELPPLLVVAVTGSAGTPYQAGVSLSDELRARLLTVDGNQTGGVFQSLPCVDNVVGRYLTDPTVLPPAGARCNTG